MDNQILEVQHGQNFMRYDQTRKILYVATNDPKQMASVRWWRKGAATYDFSVGEASGISVSDFAKGHIQASDVSEVIALLNAVLDDLQG